MSCTQMVEPIKMPLGMKTQVGLRNHVLDGGGLWSSREGALMKGVCPTENQYDSSYVRMAKRLSSRDISMESSWW